METTLPLTHGRSTLASEADNLTVYSQQSPGQAQNISKYTGERPNPTDAHLSDQLSSNDSRQLHSNGSGFLNQIQKAQQHSQQFSPRYDQLSWPSPRQSSTTLSALSIPSVIAGHHQKEQHQQIPQNSLTASLDHLDEVGQMSVTLNHRVPLGSHAGLGHGSLASSFSFGHSALRRSLSNETTEMNQQQQQTHHWNPSRSLFTAPTESYMSSRNTSSPASKANSEHQYSHQGDSVTNSHFQSTIPGHSDAIGVSGLRRSPNIQTQNHQPQNQYGQRHSQQYSTATSRGPIISAGHDISSQPRTAYGVRTSSSNSNVRDATDSGAYRGHPSPNTSLEMSSFASKLGGGIHTLPELSSYQIYNSQQVHDPPEPQYHQQHQQHGLPSPNHSGNQMRLIPPPLSLQNSMSGIIATPYENGGSGRSYSSYGNSASAPPLLPGPSGSVLSSPGGQMTLMSSMGMPYGSTGGSPGGGMSAPGGSYLSRNQPLLYSHNTMHAHHMGTHPIGHHHLSNTLAGKGLIGIGGPGSVHERPFKCDQCPQSFNRNHDLKRHKRIHLAVKPFPCNYCEKSFSRKDALKRHRLVKGCGERSSESSRNKLSITSGFHPPGSSILSDSTSDGGHDSHRLLR